MKKRLKDFVNIRSKTIKNDFSDDILYVDISSVNPDIGIIKKDLIKFNEAPSRAKKHVSHNDIIISNVRTYLKSIALIQNPEHNLIVSTGFSVLAPKRKYNPLFLSFLLKNDFFHHEVMKKSKGVSYPAINTGELLDIECLADFKNQDKIVAFLDENCSKIDTEIKLLEKKSILLDEYKNALIYETVTKGLDKNAEMKDSGVEWIGAIPNSWQVKRIKDYYLLGMGNTILKEDLIDDGLYPVYSATAEDKFFGYVNNINLTLKFGDLIIPARGNSIGYVKIIKTSNLHTCTQTTIYAKNKKNKRNSYYYYYMIGNKDKLFSYDQTAIPQITVSQVKGKILLVPTEQEQIKIADFLDLETKKIEKQIELINKKVELLKEYKQSLIYEAVTGQLEIE